jgi:hypothetical protein
MEVPPFYICDMLKHCFNTENPPWRTCKILKLTFIQSIDQSQEISPGITKPSKTTVNFTPVDWLEVGFERIIGEVIICRPSPATLFKNSKTLERLQDPFLSVRAKPRAERSDHFGSQFDSFILVGSPPGATRQLNAMGCPFTIFV